MEGMIETDEENSQGGKRRKEKKIKDEKDQVVKVLNSGHIPTSPYLPPILSNLALVIFPNPIPSCRTPIHSPHSRKERSCIVYCAT